MTPHKLRWLPTGMIGMSAMLSYLDRLLLSAAAPALMAEFHLNNEQYGQLAAVFSIPYALGAPFAGLFIDRLGLRVGVSIVVAAWSLAAASTGLAQTYGMLIAFRVALGLAESGGLPATGKTYALYLPPSEVAVGTAATQLGISLGGILAPLVFGRSRYFFGSMNSRMFANGSFFPLRSARRSATVTISVPLAASASRIDSGDGNLPVPRSSRDRKARPAIVRSPSDIGRER